MPKLNLELKITDFHLWLKLRPKYRKLFRQLPTAPLGYTRTTQRGKYSPTYQRYVAWKAFVQHVATRTLEVDTGCTFREKNKPIRGCPLGGMGIKIRFPDTKRHPDPDNVWKGIADALFEDDRCLSGSFWSTWGKGEPGVSVSIQWQEGE